MSVENFECQEEMLINRFGLQQYERLSTLAEKIRLLEDSANEVANLLLSIEDDEIKKCVLAWRHGISNMTALHRVSKKGHADVARILLENSCEINLLDKSNRTPLHWASLKGHHEVVKVLIEYNCDIGLTDDIFQSKALHMASEHGHLEVVKLLQQNDCNMRAVDGLGNTALHCAASKGHNEVVKFLLESDCCEVRSEQCNGWTVLHCAAYGGYSDLIALLLHNNCNTDAVDSCGQTALHVAAKEGHAEVVKILVENGASLEIKDTFDRTALYLSAMKDDFNEARQALLSGGAMFTMTNLCTGNAISDKSLTSTALKLADKSVIHNLTDHLSVNNSLELSKIIVSGPGNHSSKFKIYQKHIFPLLKSGQLSCLIRSNGVKDETTSFIGLACKHNLYDIVEHLLEHCEIDIDLGIPSPLWHAANGGHDKVVRLLVNYEDKPDYLKPAPDGTTPLMMVIAKGHSHLLPYFDLLYQVNSSQIIHECVKFGRIDMIPEDMRNTALKDEELLELMTEAVLSDCIESFAFVKRMFDSRGLDLGNFNPLNDLIEQRIALKIRTAAKADIYFQESPLTEMCKNFPAFNENIAPKWTDGWRSAFRKKCQVDLETEVEPHILNTFCCLPGNTSSRPMSAIKPQACQTVCTQKDNCSIIMDFLKVCHQLESKLSTKSEVMHFLKPQLFLIGSIAEGTRIGRATEADITIKFSGLDNTPFRVGRNATELLIPEADEPRHHMQRFAREGTDILDYAKFLLFFMESVDSCFDDIDENDICLEWKRGFTPCSHCSRSQKSIYQALFHCKNCLPLVTHTRLGICLILRKKSKIQGKSLGMKNVALLPVIVTIDLIPVYPVAGANALVLFSSAIKTLVEERPPFWLDYFNTLMKRDIILPENFTEVHNSDNSESSKMVEYVSIKLLHYGPEPNYMVRPRQEMSMDELQSNAMTKKVYIYMKALKDLLQVDISSYLMKKIVLLPNFKAKSQDLMAERHQNTEEHQNVVFNHLLFYAMSHPDLKKEFAMKIDYSKWDFHLKDFDRKIRNIPIISSTGYPFL